MTRFAVVHPDRVIKLIYFDSAYDHSRVPESLRFKPLHGGGPELFPTKEESESVDGVRRWISRLFGEKRGRAIYSMMEGSYSATAEYGKIKAPALAFFAIGYQKVVDWAETLPEPQRKNALEFLKAQRKYQEQEIEYFRREIPNARVVVLTNADHDVFIDREHDVLREMRAFLGAARSQALQISLPLPVGDSGLFRFENPSPGPFFLRHPPVAWQISPKAPRFSALGNAGRIAASRNAAALVRLNQLTKG